MDTDLTQISLTQIAPFPKDLDDLVLHMRYRPGWTFSLRDIDRGQDSKGLTLIITTKGFNSYHIENGQNYRVNHYMIVPAASYDRRSWEHWLFEQLLLVEKHECMEFFAIDGKRPFAPLHLPGADPYMVTIESTKIERRTKFTGELNPE